MQSMNELKFGISMRVTSALTYEETRDTISRDWSRYMLRTFPDANFLFVPNIGEQSINYVRRWDINVLILSGGDDIGVYLDRDNTERLLLRYALGAQIPIIAICRGMQLVHDEFGGKIIIGNDGFVEKHRSKRHNIGMDGDIYNVNSYHSNRIDLDSLNPNFDIYARCIEDNSIEGFRSKFVLAMMWHPERESQSIHWNDCIINNFLHES